MLRFPQFQNLIVRGTEWAATGEVTDGPHLSFRLPRAEVAGSAATP